MVMNESGVGSDGKDHLASLKEAAAAAHRQEEASEELTPVSALQQLLMRFMEDIIADMAGYVPLSIIGGRILKEFASDQFGDFKGSLVGLLAAYNYELSILQARSFSCTLVCTLDRHLTSIMFCSSLAWSEIWEHCLVCRLPTG